MDPSVSLFRYSAPKLAGYLLLSVAFSCFFTLMALGYLPSRRFGPTFDIFFGWGMLLLFGYGIITTMKRVFGGRPVVEVSRAGIRDRRLSHDLVAWSEVAQISIKRTWHGRKLRLDLTPERVARLKLLPIPRLNALLGASELLITMAGLRGSFDDLVSAIDKANPSAPWALAERKLA